MMKLGSNDLGLTFVVNIFSIEVLCFSLAQTLASLHFFLFPPFVTPPHPGPPDSPSNVSGHRAAVFLSNRRRYRGWKPSRDLSAALLHAALNNPGSRPGGEGGQEVLDHVQTSLRRHIRFYCSQRRPIAPADSAIKEEKLCLKVPPGVSSLFFCFVFFLIIISFQGAPIRGRAQSTLIATSARPHFCSLSCRGVVSPGLSSIMPPPTHRPLPPACKEAAA